MDSSTFRKSYPRLRAVTYVEANGHTIGVWVPAEPGMSVDLELDFRRDAALPDAERTRRAQQASRDAILRKINRGG